MNAYKSSIELTVLMPCLNEAATVGVCIKRAHSLFNANHIVGEILVVDNGSTDGSQQIAEQLGARVIHCPTRGYGAALQFGIRNSCGTYILMGDCDDSYHFDEAMPLILQLRSGTDVSMGSRFAGNIEVGAMPLLNRYLGNPVLTGIGRILFCIDISDFHCGMRAFNREKVLSLDLVTIGMEWASEMIVKSQLAGFRIMEAPVNLHKDGRGRPPHLRRFRDGWRHLRFMLLHAPNWVFFMPGVPLFCAGITGEIILSQGMVRIGNATLDVHSMLVMAFILVLGLQLCFTGIFANIFGHISGLLPRNEKFENIIRRLTLEKLLIVSLVLGVIGMSGFLHICWQWFSAGYPELNYQVTLRRLIPSLTLLTVAAQGIFNGFMLSTLFLKYAGKLQ